MNRRNLLKGAAAVAAALMFRPALSLGNAGEAATARLAALERRHGGRLGVAILDTGNGRQVGYRADERFLMCSTFKLLAVAAVLARVDRSAERLDRRIVFDKESVLAWAPVTSHRIGPPGMSVAELCQAAITVSDNTAANLLLVSLGGPVAVTSYARGLGDPLTRLDRVEPELNVGAPGDMRDTTTPNAMLVDLRTLLLGNALSVTSRQQLTEWLRATRTGVDKLRAGVPNDWQVGDKTGSGAHGESNDIAIIWPSQRKPLLVTAYYAASSVDGAGSDAVLAEAGRIAASL